MNKKGQAIEQIQALIVPLIAIGIVLVVGLIIMAEVKDQAIDKGSSLSHTNVTRTIIVDQYTVIDALCVEERDLSIAEIWNDTTPTFIAPITSVNYTVSGNAINITDDNRLITGTSINISYSCTYKSHAYNGTIATVNATSDIPGWLPIIVITVIGALLIGLVSYFRRQ